MSHQVHSDLVLFNETFKYKEIEEKILFEIDGEVDISFQEKFKTPFFKTEEKAKFNLDNSFFNSNCNAITDVKLINDKDLYSFEALFSVYYIEKETDDYKESLKNVFLYNQTLENIKEKFNSEVIYIQNESFFRRNLHKILLITIAIFTTNSIISAFL